MELQFEKKTKHVLAKFTVVKGEPCPKWNDIKEQFLCSDYANCLLIEDNYQDFKQRFETNLVQLTEQQVAKIDFIIAEVVNASIKLFISEDKMSAKVQVITARGGKRLSMNDIKRACLKNKIIFGVKKTLVKRLLTRVSQAEPGTEIIQLLAKGKPPERGQDAFVKPTVNLFSEVSRTHKIREDGTFDLRDRGTIDTVKEGQLVARKIDATKGIEGKTIFGEPIPAEDGEDITLSASDGTTISPDDPDIILATKEGVVRQTEQGIQVDDIFILKSLTARQGHLKFKGSVLIEGDVAADMKIEAGGDVVIGGFVESALIKCRGNIEISGGCVGRSYEDPKQHNNELYTCQLHALGSIKVKFASQTDIHSKQLVLVEKYVNNCEITADSLVVGKEGDPDGILVGGITKVSKLVSLGTAGNKLNQQTVIELDRTYRVFREKETQLWQYIEQLEAEKEFLLSTFKDAVTPLDKIKIDKKIAMTEIKLAKYKNFRKKLVIKRQEYMNAVRLFATKRVYCNVKIKLADKTISIQEIKGPSVVKLDEGKAVIEPKT